MLMGEIGWRVGSPNGSRPGFPTVQSPKVNLCSFFGCRLFIAQFLGKSATKKRRAQRFFRPFFFFISSWLVFIVSWRRSLRNERLLRKILKTGLVHMSA